MLTYTENYGTYPAPYTGESQIQKPWGTVHETGLKQISAAFTGQLESVFCIPGLSVMYGLYLDKGQLYQDAIGLTVGVRYVLGRREER